MLLSSSVSRNGFSKPAVLGLKPGPVLLAPSRPVRRTLPVPTAVDPTAVHFGFWSAVGATSVAAATLYGLAAGMQAMLKDKGVDFSSSGLDLSNAPLDINPLLARLDIDITQIDLAQLNPAVGGKMTVDAPAAAAVAGKMEVDAPAAAAIAGKVEVDASAAAAIAGKMTVDAAAAAAGKGRAGSAGSGQKEAAEAYETRLNKILKESTLAYQQTRRAQQQQPVSGTGLQQKVAALSKGYQEKVDTLWQSYERRRQQEAAKQLATEKVQLNMAEVEEANSAEAKKLNLWQRILAFFAALWAWFVRMLSQVFGGGKRSGTAGASA